MSTTVATITTGAEESPLANREAEYTLLCALMRDRQALETCADHLTMADFSDPFMGRLFGLMVQEASSNRDVNPVTLRPILEKDPSFAHFGGWATLVQMGINDLALLYDWRGLAKDLARTGRRRRMVEGLLKAAAIAEDVAIDDADMIEAIDAAVSSAGDEQDATVMRSAADLAKSYVATMNDPIESGILSRRIEALDLAIGAVRKKNLVIGAGRPGMGKTATALSYAIGAARGGHGVLIFSLEMGADELNERLLADMCFDGRGGIPYERIRERKLDPFHQRAVCRAADELAELPLHICDVSALTVPKMDRIIRRFRRRFAAQGKSLDLVIVDYLQLMSSVDRRANRYEVVSEVARGLKGIAKTHDVGVFALAQLSREVEKRPDKKPMLSDLKESGEIEQAADTVVFFLRMEYYLGQTKPDDDTSPEFQDWERMMEGCRAHLDFICAKRRAGRTGTVRGRFHSEFQAVR